MSGLDRIDATLGSTGGFGIKAATAIRIFHQREAAPVGGQPGVAVEKFCFRQFQVGGDGFGFEVLKPDISGPFAAIAAAGANKFFHIFNKLLPAAAATPYPDGCD